MSNFFKTLFSTTGVFIVLYILIGIFVNTAPPHVPAIAATAASLHSWIQYLISIFFWPRVSRTLTSPPVNGSPDGQLPT